MQAKQVVQSFALRMVSSVIAITVLSWPAQGFSQDIEEFEDATLSVVFSASDVDAQLLISGASDAPLKQVWIYGPQGLTPVSVEFEDGQNLGQADFQFDTPEPTLEMLQQAYPAGQYHFVGLTVDDNLVVNTVELTYELLPAPHILFPTAGATTIPVNGLIVSWEAINGAEALRLEIEDEETEVALKVDLPADATTFEVPNNWLQPGVEYVLDIKATGVNGNQTVTDLKFTTAP